MKQYECKASGRNLCMLLYIKRPASDLDMSKSSKKTVAPQDAGLPPYFVHRLKTLLDNALEHRRPSGNV